MQRELIEKNPLLKLSFEFSILVLDYCDTLDQLHKYTISKQLVRSGTSIGANSMEAQNAESKADFIHKLKIAAKEADESEYWLLLCKSSEGYENCDELLNNCVSIIKVLSKIIATSKLKSIS